MSSFLLQFIPQLSHLTIPRLQYPIEMLKLMHLMVVMLFREICIPLRCLIVFLIFVIVLYFLIYWLMQFMLICLEIFLLTMLEVQYSFQSISVTESFLCFNIESMKRAQSIDDDLVVRYCLPSITLQWTVIAFHTFQTAFPNDVPRHCAMLGIHLYEALVLTVQSVPAPCNGPWTETDVMELGVVTVLLVDVIPSTVKTQSNLKLLLEQLLLVVLPARFSLKQLIDRQDHQNLSWVAFVFTFLF